MRHDDKLCRPGLLSSRSFYVQGLSRLRDLLIQFFQDTLIAGLVDLKIRWQLWKLRSLGVFKLRDFFCFAIQIFPLLAHPSELSFDFSNLLLNMAAVGLRIFEP